ncbi:MAG: hypothetical protein OXU96_11100, partial [Gammaproteobacteria bacterium]|nr:hypothetical protein [Gammaproteobacteria bacterium]
MKAPTITATRPKVSSDIFMSLQSFDERMRGDDEAAKSEKHHQGGEEAHAGDYQRAEAIDDALLDAVHPPIEILHPPIEILHPPIEILHPPLEILHPPIEILQSPINVVHPSLDIVHPSLDIAHPALDIFHPPGQVLLEIFHPPGQ